VTIPAALWGLACGLLTFALTVPFDIRDLHCDDAGLRTLPRLLGVKPSIAIAIGALVISAVIPLIVAGPPKALAYSAWCVIASFFIYKSSPDRHEYYFSFLMDGLLIVLWGIFRST
jgi:4-hydroxybenzoate polyprenyltransferase